MANRDAASSKWWQLVLTARQPDETAYLLIELGAEGVSFDEQGRLHAYFRGTAEESDEFVRKAGALGFGLIERGPLKEENWLQNCRDIWQPVVAGKVKITPVLSVSERPSRVLEPHELLLIPGLGFGTGHHASTRLAIGLMQSELLSTFHPQSALDAGTGSGVLALACADLFGCPVDAIDNDPDAVENALDNVRLNAAESRISVSCGGAETVSRSYDLVLANIYAELLIKFIPSFKKQTSPGGFLILSGIVRKLSAEVVNAFTAAGFCCHDVQEEGEWAGVLLGR